MAGCEHCSSNAGNYQLTSELNRLDSAHLDQLTGASLLLTMEVATPLGVLRQVDQLLAPLPQEPLHFVAAIGEGDGLVRRFAVIGF